MPADGPAPPPPAPPLLQPASPRELFLVCSALALQGFGGVLAVVQRVLVEERRWLSRDGFVEDWAVAQVLPGPNVVNLALMLGDRWFGLRGALAAVAGLLAAPLALLMGLVLLFDQAAHLPAVQGALRGMGAVAAGLIVTTAGRMTGALRTHPLGRPAALAVTAAAVLAVAVARWPLPWVLLGLGVPVCLWTGWQLARRERGPAPEAGR